VVSYTGSPRTIFEQQNQKLCYEAIKERLVEKEPLSVELVREIHRLLTSGTYDERRYLENVEILLTKTDGTVMDLSTSGGSIRPEDGVSVCSKGQVMEEIIPLAELESISVGGIVFPIPAE
jgi:hypothetical protein